MKNKDKKEKNTNKRDNIFMIILSFCDVIAVTVLFLLYGPYNGFRDWLVTTAMGTMNHQYLATTFYNMDRIEEILSQHMDKLEAVAQFLFRNEKMDGDKFRAVMEGKPVEDN